MPDEGPLVEVDVLAGREITQVRVDFAVTLLGEHDLLSINVPFTVSHPDGTAYSIDVGERPADAANVLDRLRRTVQSGVYLERRLRLSFDDGVELVVHADHRFEAWTLNREDRSLVVCSPGGELVVWAAEPPDEA